MYHYEAKIIRWIDGDTVEVTVDLGFRRYSVERLRLIGVDAPERGDTGYAEARNRAEELAHPGSCVQIKTEKGDAFGRWLALVTTGNGVTIAQTLIDEGLGKPWVRR